MYLDLFFIFSITRGYASGAGEPEGTRLIDNEIHEMITTQVTMVVTKVIPEMFGSVNTMTIMLFDERYDAIMEAAAT